MKCKECGAHLPYGAFGNIKCEYCSTPNYIPVPEKKREIPTQPTMVEKGDVFGSSWGMLCKFYVGINEITLHKSFWRGAIILKIDGKKLESFRIWIGGKKEHIFEIGEMEKKYIKVIFDVPKLFPGIRKWKYEVYVN